MRDIVYQEERARTRRGVTLYVLGMVTGACSLVVLFLAPPFLRPGTGQELSAMAFGALLALPACALYAAVPRVLDRYDSEPLWALLAVLGWGAVAASGLSAALNAVSRDVGRMLGGAWGAELASTVLSAPVVEELWKGAAVYGMFRFFRREFDGVVDGIVYGTFVALGFAAVENVQMYARAALEGRSALAATLLVRGVLAPWGHPLYTSMTGIGFGLARESTHRHVRRLAPAGGFLAAVLLHAAWNGGAFATRAHGAATFFVLFPLWVAFVTAFLGIATSLVKRKGRILRKFLEDEIVFGHMTKEEVDFVSSPWARVRASLGMGGEPARAFVAAASRLALSKWHSERAMKEGMRTLSADFIVPLRKRVKDLRAALPEGFFAREGSEFHV